MKAVQKAKSVFELEYDIVFYSRKMQKGPRWQIRRLTYKSGFYVVANNPAN